MSSDLETTHGSSSEEGESLLAFADALLAAGRGQPSPASGDIQQYVTFFVRDDELAIPIMRCREIVRVSSITRIPEAPVSVRGVVNLRGRIIPAVDARMCLGLESAPTTARSRLIVVDVAGRSFALLVDRVARILKLAVSEVEPQREGPTLPAIAGVARLGDTLVQLVDIDRMLRTGPGLVEVSQSARSDNS